MRRLIALCLPLLWAGAVAAPAEAARIAVGPSLSPRATLSTASSLGYPGHAVSSGAKVFHIDHWAADNAIWNTALPDGAATGAPQGGQVLSVSLKGCAQGVPGYPPLREIHFQTLAPRGDGGMSVGVTSQQFSIPVCGQAGASTNTVSTFRPQVMCIDRGEVVDFNDAGGFVPLAAGLPPYPSGVPYEVLAAVPGASTSSFIRDNGTNNGAVFSPADRTNDDGFASQHGLELLLRYTLGTGTDAFETCPGGRLGRNGRPIPPPPPATTAHAGQRDGLTAAGAATVSLFCHLATPCAGTMSVSAAGHTASAPFTVAPMSTGHVKLTLGRALIAMARRHGGSLPARVSILTPSAGSRATYRGSLRLTVP